MVGVIRMFYNKYKKLAYWDLLCACYNRNFLEHKLKKSYKNKQVYISIIDVNNFKQINDKYGHFAGDSSLNSLIHMLSDTGQFDYICRFGGDEFVLLHRFPVEFRIYKELFRQKTGHSFSSGTVLKLEDESFDAVLSIADRKLYEEKGDKK